MILHSGRVSLRPSRPEDSETILAILQEPGVFKWWGTYDLEKVRSEFEDAAEVLVIELAGTVVGAIQYWEDNEPMYRRAAVDIFLTTSRHGQGLGAEAIRMLARYLFDERGHHRLTIDPAVSNEAAIRAYERVGFRPVGVMRQYERGPDGAWRDGLLMDMLRDDFND
jgi:aminoglycoside 6'-N-acetyltransferase